MRKQGERKKMNDTPQEMIDDVDELLFQIQKNSYQVVRLLKDDEFLEASHNWSYVAKGAPAYSVKHGVKGQAAEWYKVEHNALKELLVKLSPFSMERFDGIAFKEEEGNVDEGNVDVICVRIYLIPKIYFGELDDKLSMQPSFTWQRHDDLLALAQIVLLDSKDSPLSSHRVGISEGLRVLQNKFIKITDKELWKRVKEETLRTYESVTQVTGKEYEPYHGLTPNLRNALREEYGLDETPFEKTLIREEYDGSGEVIRQTYVIDSD